MMLLFHLRVSKPELHGLGVVIKITSVLYALAFQNIQGNIFEIRDYIIQYITYLSNVFSKNLKSFINKP